MYFPNIKPSLNSLACRKPIYGIGINDADYVTNPVINGKQIMCPAYDKWLNMFSRCYGPKTASTYVGCTVDPQWHSFMNFRSWLIGHENWHSLHLDKDILIPGNKIYGPDTCCLVSSQVNSFFTHVRKKSSKYPVGVQPASNKFRARIASGDGKYICSKSYSTIEEASAAYVELRQNRAIYLASLESNPRIAQAIIDYEKNKNIVSEPLSPT